MITLIDMADGSLMPENAFLLKRNVMLFIATINKKIFPLSLSSKLYSPNGHKGDIPIVSLR